MANMKPSAPARRSTKYTRFVRGQTKRMPYGIVMGPLDVGKTTIVSEAFPDFAVLATSASAMQAPLGYLESHGRAFPSEIFLLDDERDEEGMARHDWFDTIVKRFSRWRKLVKQAKTGPYIPKGAQFLPGMKLEAPIRGVIISEATSLMKWIDRDAKREFGRSFDTNGRVINLMGLFNAWNLATGLGLILDTHSKPAEWPEPREEYSVPTTPEGPAWPFREMRAAGVQDMDFAWKVTNEGHGDERRVLLHTRAENTEVSLIRTRAPKHVVNSPFVQNRGTIDLTDEGITVRDVLREAGFELPFTREERAAQKVAAETKSSAPDTINENIEDLEDPDDDF